MTAHTECTCPAVGKGEVFRCPVIRRMLSGEQRDQCASSEEFRRGFAALPPQPEPGSSMPPLRTQAGNALKAAGRVVKAGCCGRAVVARQAVIEARRAVCEGCEKNRDGRCLECGCVLAAKQRLATEVCPLGLWPKP